MTLVQIRFVRADEIAVVDMHVPVRKMFITTAGVHHMLALSIMVVEEVVVEILRQHYVIELR